MYKTLFLKSAVKEFLKLAKKYQILINNELIELSKNPLKINVKKLSGFKNAYRLRANRYRIMFLRYDQEKTIKIVAIFMEKDKNDYQFFIKRILIF